MSSPEPRLAGGPDYLGQALDVAAIAAREAGASPRDVADWKRKMRRSLGPTFFSASPEGRVAELDALQRHGADAPEREALRVLRAIATAL